MSAFNPTRLTLARKRKGLTKVKLATEVGVSTRSATAYEAGEKQPSPLTAASIAAVLGFPIDFFFGDDVEELPVKAASFRALCSMTQRQRDQAKSTAEIAIILNDWIEKQFEGLPCSDVPDLPNMTPDTAAEIVREQWGLGERPIRNMIHLLEKHGVRVFSLAEESRHVDGLSFWRRPMGTPFVLLDTTKSAERSRMDAAHELGHLVMHAGHACDQRTEEAEAKAFASAFLMPEGSILAGAPRNPTVNDILRAKRQWNVSASALAVRMHKLGLLSRYEYQSLFKQMNARGLLTSETNGAAHESSQVLDKVFRSLKAEGKTKAEIAHELSLPVAEIETLVFDLVLRQIPGGGEITQPDEHELAKERRKSFRLA